MSAGSFVRALSPLSHSLAQLATAGLEAPERGLKERQVRVGHLQGLASVAEVVAAIPGDYQSVLAPELRLIEKRVRSLLKARATHAAWERHLAAGTFPAGFAPSDPNVQLTKEFAEEGSGRTIIANLKAKAKADAVAILGQSVRAKADERDRYEAMLDPAAILGKVAPLVQQQWTVLQQRMRVPQFGPNPDSPNDLMVTGWDISDAAKSLHEHVLHDFLHYAYRVRAILESEDLAASLKRDAKRKVAGSAAEQLATGGGDVDMTDAQASGSGASPSNRTMQSMIDKAVSSALKSRDKKGKGKKPAKTTKKTRSSSTPARNAKEVRQGGGAQGKGKGKAKAKAQAKGKNAKGKGKAKA
ncbi:hypothetical protein K488DRAFT_92110 [Vararia minispora EC-137]|uniref:Uncharacterized protein n=1 Tax=Vararia minispora EC-137 TaxID=1314806 RepID=A0ACB8Q4Z0_9AGAM|nr:hypothetical protein K488DRAFT_92110 [Vararia minispora EC-137]